MTMPDNKVTTGQEADPADAFLAEAEQRWETAENARWQDYPTALEHLSKALRSTADVPRLLAAVRKVRERHGPGRNVVLGGTCLVHENHRFFSITAIEAATVDACQDCEGATYLSCAACGDHVPLDRCPDRVAITEALTGKAGTDD
jgi:hypothetical protein